MPSRTLDLPYPIDLLGTWRGVRRGRHSPTVHVGDDGIWRATRTPGGPATMRVVPDADRMEITAWGEGADAVLDAAPEIVGAADHVDRFDPQHPVVARLWRQYGDHRVPRTGAVAETLVSVVLEQRVTTFEARRAQTQITRRWGDPAPGPTQLLLPPDPEVLANVPYYDLHVLGVEQARADTVRRVAASAPRLDALVHGTLDDAWDRLVAILGVGRWSVAHTMTVALGDPDVVPIGDAHLPSDVTHALTGTAIDDDEAMLDALDEFSGQRGRVIRLIEAAGLRAPRRAPRYAPRDHRRD